MFKTLGHRGIVDSSTSYYQNTLDAFELALKFCDGFETDVCQSADGELFMAHVSTVRDGETVYSLSEHLDIQSQHILASKRLDEMPSEEIELLRLKNGKPLPRIEDVLALLTLKPEKILNLELKTVGVSQILVKKLKVAFEERVIALEQLVISSFNHKELLEIRKAFPDIQIGFLMESPQGGNRLIAPWLDGCRDRYQPLTEAYMVNNLFKEIHPQWVVFPSFSLSEGVVDMIKKHHADIKIAVWVYSEIEKDATVAARSLLDNPFIDLAIVDTPHILFA